MLKLRIISAFVVIVLFCVGCAKIGQLVTPKNNELMPKGVISSIELTCLLEDCDNHYFEDKNSISIFINAIEEAVMLDGMLDYGAEYEVIITTNQELKKYDLSLGNEKSRTGLLVSQSNTVIGYRINIENADKLRELLAK